MRLNLTKPTLLVLVITLALLVRVHKLSESPNVINGDEMGSLIHPLQILHTPHISLFSLTHDYSVSNLIYLPKAVFIKLTAESQVLLMVRLVTAFASLGTLIGFYLLVSKYVKPSVAFLSTLLLSSNFIFLSFSRVSWINMDSVFFAVWLFYFLDNYKKAYLIPTVLCSTGLLYQYMGGRPFLLLVPLIFITKTLKNKSMVPLGHLVLVLAGVLLLFLPQIKPILSQPDSYLRRASSVYIFSPPLTQPLSKIIKDQLVTLFKGLVIFDPSVGRSSVENRRLLPSNTRALHPLLILPYLSGILLTLQGKKTHRLWLLPLIINFALIQFPTASIPSWGRALPIFPIIFFFIAISLNTLLEFFKFSRVVLAGLVCASLLIFTTNVIDYFDWLSQPEYSQVHEPAIQLSDLPLWINHQRQYAIEGKFPFDAYSWKDSILPSLKNP